MLVETLRADWTARETNARVCALPTFEGGDLMLGAATKIAGAREAPLALTHLALAGVGRLDDPREDARRLFIADGLMKAGVPPRTILEALGAPPAPANLDRAYNPDQPRVSAGNGRPSGRWTSGDGASNGSAANEDRPSGARGLQVADASSTRGQETVSDAAPTLASSPSAAGSSIAGSLLDSFWAAVPGTHYSGLAVEAWHRGDYVQFSLYEAAATLEVGLNLVPGVEAASESLTLAERRAIQLAANKLAGQAFNNQVGSRIWGRDCRSCGGNHAEDGERNQYAIGLPNPQPDDRPNTVH